MLRGKISDCFSKSVGNKELYFIPTEETRKIYDSLVSLQSCLIDASRDLSMGRRMGERLTFPLASMGLIGPVLGGMSGTLDSIEDALDDLWDEWASENLTNNRYFIPDGEDTLA